MKPTKEQLADPKWWEFYVGDKNYCYWQEKTNSLHATSLKMIDSAACHKGLELLAKRPEPEQWRPEVGEMCEVWVENVGYWAKITVLAVDKDTIVWRNGTDRKSYIGTRISDARPIKTQREELIDIVHQRGLAKNKAGAITDAILARFDLTEKDGN